MTDGIGRIFGGNNYGVGGFGPQKKDDAPKNDVQQPVVNYQETQVDPSKVMEFMANNNFFIAPTNSTTATTPVELDQATQDRIGGYMEKFELIFGIVQEEFGEENAPMVMDFVMDNLMGMTA